MEQINLLTYSLSPEETYDPDHCYQCGAKATKLCDGRVAGGTCDRPMCGLHAHQIGCFIACVRGGKGKRSSFHDTRDLCDRCFADRQTKQQPPAQQAKTTQNGMVRWLEAKRSFYKNLEERFIERGEADIQNNTVNPATQAMRRYEVWRIRQELQAIDVEMEWEADRL